MSCLTCDALLKGAQDDEGASPSWWGKYGLYIVAALLLLAGIYLYKKRKKG